MAEGLELKDKSRLRYPINGAWGILAPDLLPVGVEIQAQWRLAPDPKLR